MHIPINTIKEILSTPTILIVDDSIVSNVILTKDSVLLVEYGCDSSNEDATIELDDSCEFFIQSLAGGMHYLEVLMFDERRITVKALATTPLPYLIK